MKISSSERAKAWKKNLIDKGLCVKCKQPNDRVPKQECTVCAKVTSKMHNDRHKQNKARTYCAGCQQPYTGINKYCDYCKVKGGRPGNYRNPTFAQPDELLEFIYSKTEQTLVREGLGLCTEWKGDNGNTKKDYGWIVVEGKPYQVHRVVYCLEKGIDPKTLSTSIHLLHSCDNPCCCAKAHLREGTPQENSDDKISRSRDRKSTKVSDIIILEILNKYDVAVGSFRPSAKALAKEYGLFWKYVERVLAGKERKSLTQNYAWKYGKPQHWSRYKQKPDW